MRSCIRITRIVLLLVLLATFASPVLAMTDDEAEEFAQALRDQGFEGVYVSPQDDWVYIAISQNSSDITDWAAYLQLLAGIAVLAQEHSSTINRVTIALEFEDGNKLSVWMKSDMARDFLDGTATQSEFEEHLDTQSDNRGPLLVPGVCVVSQGDSCANDEACTCYPNERCEPGHGDANPQGCVIEFEPENAYLQDGQYACLTGYEWNDTADGCVPEPDCSLSQFAFEGECYETPLASTSNPTTYKQWQTDRTIRRIVEILGFLLIPVVIVAIIVIVIIIVRRRRKRKVTEPAVQPAVGVTPSQPQITPPPPVRTTPPPSAPSQDPRFAQLEHQYAQLTRDAQNGRISPQEFKTRTQKLVTQDHRGRWAFSIGQWLWFDGRSWVPRDPRK